MTEIRNLSAGFAKSLNSAASDNKIIKSEINELKSQIKTEDDQKVFDILTKDKTHVSFNINEGTAQKTFNLNIDLEEKSSTKPKKVFPQNSPAQEFLSGLSGGAFNQNFTPEASLTRFEASFRVPRKAESVKNINAGNYANFNQDNFKNLNSFDGLKGAVVKSYDQLVQKYNSLPEGSQKQQLKSQLDGLFSSSGTQTPSSQQIESYIKANPDQAALIIGDMLGNSYVGLTSFTGDANPYKSLQAWAGVCTDTHSVITALRTALGQEAYVVNSSGNDAFHVFSVFKDKDGTWSIQNYGNIYKTDAKTLDELYDKAMPEQRFISAYSVGSDGSLNQAGKYRTSTGLREEMFRGFSGTGDSDPWKAENGISAGNQGFQVNYNGMHLGFSFPEGKIGASYHKKSGDENSTNISGVAAQVRTQGPLPGAEVKYESETVRDDGQSFGRTYWNVFAGGELASNPTYWGWSNSAAGNGDLLLRAGARYETNQSKLYGDGNLKFELGYSWGAGATINVDASGKDKSYPLAPLATYGGQTFNGLIAYGNVNTGVLYKPNDNLTARFGLSSGLNLGNGRIDGISNFGQQALNALDLKTYADVRYSSGNFAANALANWHIDDPKQFELGLGAAYVNKDISIGGAYYVRPSIGGMVDGLRVGASWKPTENIDLNAYAQTPVFGYSNSATTFGVGATFRLP